MSYQTVTWTKEPIKWTKLQQMAENDQYIYEQLALLPKGYLNGVKLPATVSNMDVSAGYDVPGMSTSVTLNEPRNIRVGFTFRSISSSANDTIFGIRLIENSGGPVMEINVDCRTAALGVGGTEFNTIVSRVAGTYEYKLNIIRQTGTGTATLDSPNYAMAFLYVEDVGAAVSIPEVS